MKYEIKKIQVCLAIGSECDIRTEYDNEIMEVFMRTIFIVCLLAVSVMSDARKIRNIAHLYDDGKRTLEIVCIDYASDATTLTFRTTKTCTPTLKVGHGIYIVDDNGNVIMQSVLRASNWIRFM